MESEGQRAASNPSAMLAALVGKREKLQDELRSLERQVYEMETTYLQESNLCGSVLKGFEGFLSTSKSTTNLKRSRKFQPEERLFSLSSVTSPADPTFAFWVEEQAAGRDDGRADYGPGRLKGGGISANGQGKPKKGGRPAIREARRIRLSSEQDLEDEDDFDLSYR